MGIIAFIFAYFSTNEKQQGIKWFYLVLTFAFMTAALDIFRRISVLNGLGTGVSGMLELLTGLMMILTGFMIFLFVVYTIRIGLELWMPKKKSFRDKREV